MSTEVETPAVEVDAPETPKAKKEPKAPVKCKCGLYSKVEDQNGEAVLVELVSCTATTNGNFAPGHDAKLKSQLIQLGAADASVYKSVDGEDVEMSAQDAANEYGFAAKVASGIERLRGLNEGKDAKAQARADKKAQADQERAAKKAAREAEAAEKKAAKAEAAAAKKAEKDAEKAAADAAKTESAPAADSSDESLF